MSGGTFQQVIICGNLGRDPEVRTFQNGGKVCNLRIATSDSWKDKSTGEKRERSEWHSVAVFQEGGVKFLEENACKGTKVFIKGELQTRKWQDQSGQDRYTTEVVVQPFKGEVMILDKWKNSRPGGSGGGDDGPRSGNGYEYKPDTGGVADVGRSRDIDDEIPF